MSREYASVFAKLNRNFSAYKPIFGMRIPRIDEALDKCEAQRAQNMYDSILNNRHNTAHGEGSDVTFGDVKQYYEHGHCVLDYFQDALFQSVDETA